MLELFATIKAFALDVDGVLTDGTLLLLPDGVMARQMHIKDGYALQLAVKKGYPVFIISGGISAQVEERLRKLGITEIYMGVHDKKMQLQQLLNQYQIDAGQVLFMGDDIPDLEAMQHVGLPCAPCDACSEIQQVSRYISPLPGGTGCVRDVIEKVMKLQGKWMHSDTITSR